MNKPKFKLVVVFAVVALVFIIVLAFVLRSDSSEPGVAEPAEVEQQTQEPEEPEATEEPEPEIDTQPDEIELRVDTEDYESFKTRMQDPFVDPGDKIIALEEFVRENKLEPTACWKLPGSDHLSFDETVEATKRALEGEEVTEASIRVFLEEFLELVDSAEDTGSDTFDDAVERLIVSSKIVESDDNTCVYDYLDYSI